MSALDRSYCPTDVAPPIQHESEMSPGRARLWLGAYLMALTGVAFVHSPAALAVLCALALGAAGVARWRLLRRTLLAVLVFNVSVSLGHVLMAAWQGLGPSWAYLGLMNLRVLLMVFLGFWFVSRVNLVAALSFSRMLGFLATLAIGQVQVFARLRRDFRLAFVSRNPQAAGWHSRLRHSAAHAACLLDKSVARAEDTSLAMRSRGCFDD